MTLDAQGHLILPRGTRVVLTAPAPGPDGALLPAGTPGRVDEADHPRYVLRTPAGTRFEADRAQLRIHQPGVAEALTQRAADWEALEPSIVLSVVVGSSAWGLAEDGSDEDLRGAFLLPFDRYAGLHPRLDELRAPDHDAQYLEVERFLRLALDADVNVTEALWAPTVRHLQPPGAWLREARERLLSRRAYTAFGRYALGQIDRMEAQLAQAERDALAFDALRARPDAPPAQALLAAHLASTPEEARREVKRMTRSLLDRGLVDTVGPESLAAYAAATSPEPVDVEAAAGAKNAYNLLRILHSGIALLEDGAPLIHIAPDRPDHLREHLLQIKRRALPLRAVIAEARDLAARLEDAFRSSPLPPHPDLDAAHELLIRCRRWSLGAG